MRIHYRSPLLHLIPALFLAPLTVGCDAPAAKPPAASPPPPSASPLSDSSTPAAPAAATSFASMDSAVATFREACVERDSKQITACMRWLSQQGDSAAAPMGKLALDPATDVGTRVAATRVLALIGTPSAAELILQAAKSEESKVRVKAAESLGVVRPSTTPIVDRLIALLDDNDRFVRSSTIKSLKAIGPKAERAAPKLQEILNSDAPEQLRMEAHAALKVVAPRVGFRQGELDE